MRALALGLVVVTLASASPASEAPGSCRRNSEAFHSEEGGCLHFGTGLVFSMKLAGKFSQEEAAERCTSLREAGFTDWRLPTRSELIAVAEGAKSNPFAFSTVGFLWTSTTDEARAAQVLLDPEDIAFESKSSAAEAVCVRKPADRDGDGVPSSSDVCNVTPKGARVETTGPRKGCASGDSEVEADAGCAVESVYFRSAQGGCQDASSGLVWSKPMPGKEGIFHAGRYCSQLIEGFGSQTHTDWRLPTLPEAIAISGRDRAVRHFRSVPTDAIWTGTVADRSGHGDRYHVKLSDGTQGYQYRLPQFADFRAAVLCVRQGAR